MDATFWHERWAANQIGFHQSDYNALMIAGFPALGLAPGARVFVPLCGKSRDIAWLLDQGCRVVGAELSRLAVDSLFAELGIAPQTAAEGPLERFAAPELDVFVGDIFDLSTQRLGPVDAVYDRAALVALPSQMRPRYAAHLRAVTAAAPQLLICFDYDQSAMEGPPFSIHRTEVERLYGADFTLTQVADAPVEGGLKGMVPARETAWLLR